MFELAHPAAAPKDWQNLDVLVSKGHNESNFNAMDWDAVPKLDYASSQFRQLAIPEPARVIDQRPPQPTPEPPVQLELPWLQSVQLPLRAQAIVVAGDALQTLAQRTA